MIYDLRLNRFIGSHKLLQFNTYYRVSYGKITTNTP